MPTVLLVEDDKENYNMLMRRLQRRGYDVALAVDGEEAVEQAAEVRPDLILMDIRLPKQNGYEATQKIRELPERNDVPIIALTAHALEEDRDEALSAGCDDYHAKPVHFKKLLEQMEALLDGQPRE